MSNQNQNTFASWLAAGINTANTAETVIATSRAVQSPYPGASFLIECDLEFTPGTSATALTLRIRRDSLTGTQVAVSPALTVAAGAPIISRIVAIDSLIGDVAGQLWVLTGAQTAGAAAGVSANVGIKVTTGV